MTGKGTPAGRWRQARKNALMAALMAALMLCSGLAPMPAEGGRGAVGAARDSEPKTAAQNIAAPGGESAADHERTGAGSDPQACWIGVPVRDFPGMERIGNYQRTFYQTIPGVTGDIGASGQKLFDGAVAVNPADMRRMGVAYGDELCLVAADGSESWVVVLDAAAASGIVDCYTTGGIPWWGTDKVEVWVKR